MNIHYCLVTLNSHTSGEKCNIMQDTSAGLAMTA